MNSGDLVKSVIKLSLIALLIFVLYKLSTIRFYSLNFNLNCQPLKQTIF